MIFNNFKKIKKNNDPFTIREGEYSNLEKSSYRLKWTEDSFMPEAESKQTIGRSFSISRVYIIGLILSLFILLILGRTAWLQIVKGDYYYTMAEGNRIRIERLEAKRGVIYDRSGNSLVRNTANFLLYIVPIDLPEDEVELGNIINRISGILGDKSPEEIKNILGNIKPGSLEAYQPLFIADNIEYEKAMLLYLESSDWPGVVLSNKTRREYYLPGLSLAHILGYIGKINEDELKTADSDYLPIDYIGKTGIENFWENELKGVNGKKQIEVNALGKEKKILSQKEADDGHNLVLAIDSELQKKMEEVMAVSLNKLKLQKGVAIAMNPNNGEVLAMVSLPSYDINLFAKGIKINEYNNLISNADQPLFNRAISGEYPSGSTIKPVMAAAALEDGIINEHTSFLSVGGIGIGQWFFPDWKSGGHGLVDVKRALAESINTFFYYIGGGYHDFKGLGIERIIYYENLFGLGSQVGIDLPAEAGGFLPTKKWKEETKGEQWYIGDTYHLSIGQGDILVTPLQVAVYTSFFANGGNLYRPYLVKQVLDSHDKVINNTKPTLIRNNFIKNSNVAIVRQGMRQAVTSGSAVSLSSLLITVAGKTGTAQWSSVKNPHAWFTGFAPYENPVITITILIEEGGEGSSVAVPIAKEVLEWYFADK